MKQTKKFVEIMGDYDLPDGVYFIAGTSDSEVNTKTYARYTPGMTEAPIKADYIGVKLGRHAIAVALKDLPGNEDGELEILPLLGHTAPEFSEHYSWDKKQDRYRFNPFADFDGKGNTERLKEYGSEIGIPEGEWVPSLGELNLLDRASYRINKAIELVGGSPIKGLYASSTMSSQHLGWLFNIEHHSVLYSFNDSHYRVRTVAAF